MSSEVLKDIFMKSVEAVQPRKLIRQHVSVHQRHLTVCGTNYSLQRPCHLVGFGKAVLDMALELEEILGSDLKMGVVSVPEGILDNRKTTGTKLRFFEGARNNIPDEKAMKAAQEIKNLIESLGEDDLLLVLISGGGSALLPLPKPPITLAEKQELIRELGLRGADILELNTVRKQMSLLKGGGLVEFAYPARVVGLVLSDIVGDPLDFIASGPTTPNWDKPGDSVGIIMKYGLLDTVPNTVRTVLTKKEETERRRTLFNRVDNFIIGNNRIAAESARDRAILLGYQTAILSTSITGNVSEVSELYVRIVEAIVDRKDRETLRREFPSISDQLDGFNLNEKVCVIGGGEPTVVVRKGGKGGRNQHLALDFSLRVNRVDAVRSADISFLSCGTDGMDGPTDAAGAIGTSDLVHYCARQNIKPADYLNNTDSYNFYRNFLDGRYLIKTGHTGTNVMDVHVLLVHPKNSAL